MKNTLALISIVFMVGGGAYLAVEFLTEGEDEAVSPTTTMQVNSATNDAASVTNTTNTNAGAGPGGSTVPVNGAENDVADQDRLFEAARAYVAENSVENMEFELDITTQLDAWALLTATPTNVVTDPAMVVLEYVEGEWTPRGFGTSLPDLEEEVPDLFERGPVNF